MIKLPLSGSRSEICRPEESRGASYLRRHQRASIAAARQLPAVAVMAIFKAVSPRVGRAATISGLPPISSPRKNRSNHTMQTTKRSIHPRVRRRKRIPAPIPESIIPITVNIASDYLMVRFCLGSGGNISSKWSHMCRPLPGGEDRH